MRTPAGACGTPVEALDGARQPDDPRRFLYRGRRPRSGHRGRRRLAEGLSPARPPSRSSSRRTAAASGSRAWRSRSSIDVTSERELSASAGRVGTAFWPPQEVRARERYNLAGPLSFLERETGVEPDKTLVETDTCQASQPIRPAPVPPVSSGSRRAWQPRGSKNRAPITPRNDLAFPSPGRRGARAPHLLHYTLPRPSSPRPRQRLRTVTSIGGGWTTRSTRFPPQQARTVPSGTCAECPGTMLDPRRERVPVPGRPSPILAVLTRNRPRSLHG